MSVVGGFRQLLIYEWKKWQRNHMIAANSHSKGLERKQAENQQKVILCYMPNHLQSQ